MDIHANSDFESRINRIGIDAIRRVAEAGFCIGQYLYGLCFAAGVKVPRDLETAAYWIKLAADQEFVPAKTL